MLERFGGATIRRTIDRSHADVPEPTHDWPVLSLFVIGAYSNQTETGEQFFAGPSAVLYRAGVAHRNVVGPAGFEQIEIEFDPDWLGRSLLPDKPLLRWAGGWAGAETRTLARRCSTAIPEGELRSAVRQFVERASCQREHQPPINVGLLRVITAFDI